jgi:hypothetical protein
MDDTFTCPRCGGETAFFNGVSYECPECDLEWGFDGDINNYKEEAENDTDDYYEELAALEKPYFKLKHGKLYKCVMGCFDEKEKEYITEDICIVPLAFEENKNRLFILYLIKPEFYFENPKEIKRFAKMDFTTIWNDGITAGAYNIIDTPFLDIICTSSEDGELIDSNDCSYFNFVEITKKTELNKS